MKKSKQKNILFDEDFLDRAERRAAAKNLDFSKYIRELVKNDLNGFKPDFTILNDSEIVENLKNKIDLLEKKIGLMQQEILLKIDLILNNLLYHEESENAEIDEKLLHLIIAKISLFDAAGHSKKFSVGEIQQLSGISENVLVGALNELCKNGSLKLDKNTFKYMVVK